MPTKARPRPVVAILMALTLALAACGRETKPPGGHDPGAPARTVVTAVVTRSGDGGVTAVPATVQARQRAALAARIPASVIELPWREGDRVAAGAVVARLDDTALRSALAAAEAAGERGRRRPRAGGGPAEERRGHAQGGRGEPGPCGGGGGGGRGRARQPAYAVLRAPFEGTVAARPANVGDVVSPGTTLIEIEGRGGLEVRATVEADLASRLRPGRDPGRSGGRPARAPDARRSGPFPPPATRPPTASR